MSSLPFNVSLELENFIQKNNTVIPILSRLWHSPGHPKQFTHLHSWNEFLFVFHLRPPVLFGKPPPNQNLYRQTWILNILYTHTNIPICTHVQIHNYMYIHVKHTLITSLTCCDTNLLVLMVVVTPCLPVVHGDLRYGTLPVLCRYIIRPFFYMVDLV